MGDPAVEERGPQQDPHQDLTQDRRLPQALGGDAQQPGQDDDDRHVRQEQLDVVEAHGPPPTSITSPTGGGVSRTEVRIRPPGESERLPRAGSALRAAGWWDSAPPVAGPGSHWPN